ncbi:hypothetical protein [Roseiarcus sp.]|uniref:hypothetical protein n=1 Tax=Roseiarcus sp. TaxID=1969460 RepID=UPI003F962785
MQETGDDGAPEEIDDAIAEAHRGRLGSGQDYPATPDEGRRLTRAFIRIEQPNVRELVLRMVEFLSAL